MWSSTVDPSTISSFAPTSNQRLDINPLDIWCRFERSLFWVFVNVHAMPAKCMTAGFTVRFVNNTVRV